MVEVISFFKNLNINEIFATIISTFAGAWLAYKWTEKTQQGIEKRAKQEEQQKDRENKTWQLNYLNIFLYTHIKAFIELLQHLQIRLGIVEKFLQAQSLSESEHQYILSPISEYQIDFPLNVNELLFVADDEDFIKGLVFTKTSLANYYEEIQMLNNSLSPLQVLVLSNQLTSEHIKVLKAKIRFVIEGISYTICTFHKTLEIAKKYNEGHDKLPLNKIKEFTNEEQTSIKFASDVRQSIYKHLKQQKNAYGK
ncbi:hypothetical protein [Candidatus Proelusimicrobium excrementi]|uniref:hypothetical protein n=1 Tax=Candidatus Proelusimicrobium excrementi TaxID=3416222 RepID=UPI003D120170